MEKKRYEYIKALREKQKIGTATFQERNIILMEDKRVRKEAAAKAEAQAKAQVNTRSAKRFGGMATPNPPQP